MSERVRARHAKLLVIVTVMLLAGCAPLPADEISVPVPAPENEGPSGSELIEGYRKWTRLNPEPAWLPSRLAILCFAPTARQLELDKVDPHRDKFITVYVNDLGKKPMTTQLNPNFPPGSIIVKEKLPAKDSSSPELLTVMIKREAGYNPEHGDWEYMAVDGSGKEVKARGRLENCQGCHSTRKETGYVYREYLPREVWEEIK